MYQDNYHSGAVRAIEHLIEKHIPASLASRKGLPSAEEVRRLTADVPRIPAISGNLDTVRGRVKQPRVPVFSGKKPKTLDERRAAAKEAVRLAKSGVRVCRALLSVGLHPSYTAALRECVAGHGPVTDATRAMDLSPISQDLRKDAVFIRWFYDIGTIRDGEEEQAETDKLRAAFLASGLTDTQMEKRSGVSRETLFNLRNKRTSSMRIYHRRKVWNALNSQN